MSVPKKDSLLVAWTTNFSTRITATPATFGLVAGQATTYAALSDAFVTAAAAVAEAREAGIRSPTGVIVGSAVIKGVVPDLPYYQWQLCDVERAVELRRP